MSDVGVGAKINNGKAIIKDDKMNNVFYNIFLFCYYWKDLFLSKYLDDLLMVPKLSQVQGIISLSVLKAEVNSLVLEESDDVHISLIRSMHDGGELKRAIRCVQISSGCSQSLQRVQVLLLQH